MNLNLGPTFSICEFGPLLSICESGQVTVLSAVNFLTGKQDTNNN